MSWDTQPQGGGEQNQTVRNVLVGVVFLENSIIRIYRDSQHNHLLSVYLIDSVMASMFDILSKRESDHFQAPLHRRRKDGLG